MEKKYLRRPGTGPAKWVAALALSLLAAAAHAEGASRGEGRFALVQDGRCVAKVVAAAGPERAAAEFFADEAAKCVGARFEVVDAPPDAGNRIVFSVSAAIPKEEDAYAIDFPDERTMRLNCSPVSARWAVNRLLKDAFGIRWLFAKPARFKCGELNEYPQARDVSVPRREVRQGPYSFWSLRHADWTIDDWRAHWDEKGRRSVHYMTVDVFPLLKYAWGQGWPAEVMPTHGGKKLVLPKATAPLPANPALARKSYRYSCSHWNPCFTNPKCAEIAIENILESLEKDPSKKLVSLDVNDNGGFCECAACAASCGGRRNSVGMLHHSDAYYAWANRIAEAVTARYPDVYFPALGYREVTDPPGFRLHPHVLVRVCFEFASMTDPEVRARRLATMAAWKKCADNMEAYDYSYGINWYCFPRIHYKVQSEIMRELHDHFNVCGYYAESRAFGPFEGPKHYLLGEVLKDCSADPSKVVREWCECAVGEKAARPLLKYYRFWEDYCCGSEIRKTEWFEHAKNNIYLPGGRMSPMFALKKGDMARCRALMEQVVALADTPMRVKRAKLLMEFFELVELSAKAVLAEEMPTSGHISSAAEAVSLLRGTPGACAARDVLVRHPRAKFLGMLDSIAAEQRNSLSAVVPYAGDAAVKAELSRLAADASVPDKALRGIFRVWAGEKAENLVENGSFEDAAPMPFGWFAGRMSGRRVDDAASDGRWSVVSRNLMAGYKFVPEPGKTYLVMFDAQANKSSSEGKINLKISPLDGEGHPTRHVSCYDLSVPQGMWQTYSGVVTALGGKNGKSEEKSIAFHIFGKNYEPDEKVWLDNVRVYCVDGAIERQ